jgi:hypothetical protein
VGGALHHHHEHVVVGHGSDLADAVGPGHQRVAIADDDEARTDAAAIERAIVDAGFGVAAR